MRAYLLHREAYITFYTGWSEVERPSRVTSIITDLSCYSNTMGILIIRSLSTLLLICLSLTSLVTCQPCFNKTTSIKGKPFPPLIEATTENLIVGLETGLFTSVDLVKVC